MPLVKDSRIFLIDRHHLIIQCSSSSTDQLRTLYTPNKKTDWETGVQECGPINPIHGFGKFWSNYYAKGSHSSLKIVNIFSE